MGLMNKELVRKVIMRYAELEMNIDELIELLVISLEQDIYSKLASMSVRVMSDEEQEKIIDEITSILDGLDKIATGKSLTSFFLALHIAEKALFEGKIITDKNIANVIAKSLFLIKNSIEKMTADVFSTIEKDRNNTVTASMRCSE